MQKLARETINKEMAKGTKYWLTEGLNKSWGKKHVWTKKKK